MRELRVATLTKRQVLDITDQVATFLPTSGSGIAHVFVAHTTAAITTADLDPGTDLDLLDALSDLLPQKQWRHPHDPAHAPDHLLSSIIGPDAAVPYETGKLLLGSWQRIILIEFDGPRERTVRISVL
jgi:secondary thiamine-phosphate synthase enzyme